MATYNNKPILSLRSYCNIGDFANLGGIWEEAAYWAMGCSTYDNDIVYLTTEKDFNAKLAAKTVKTINPGSTLFFSSSSKFPRFKLAESDYKRCIKIEKANYIVYDDIPIKGSSEVIMLEDETYVYVWRKGWSSSSFSSRTAFGLRSEWDKDPIEYIKNHHLYYGAEINLLYEGKAMVVNNKYKPLIDLVLDPNNNTISFVTDKLLDEKINGTFDVLDEEAVRSICDMLDSPDRTTQGVGLKVLTGYNVQETPLTVRTILGLRENLCGCTEWKGVGVQQVLKSIDWHGFGRFPANVYNILPSKDDLPKYTDYDKSLVSHVYKNAVLSFMNQKLDEINATGIPQTFNWSVKYELQE